LAIKVHKTVGPERLEQIYQDCPCHEMALNGLGFRWQVELAPIYGGVRPQCAYRTDIVAGEAVILQIKSIEHIPPVHEAPLPADPRPTSCAVRLLLNPDTPLLKDDPRRFIDTSSPRPPGTPRPPCLMQAASRPGPCQ
jgi:GxxExxY protein